MRQAKVRPEGPAVSDGTRDTTDSDARSEHGVELDPRQLSRGALRGLVEEYVTREGTDYGHGDWSLEDKVGQVFGQLERGEARIVFDLESESASIVTSPELALHTLHDQEHSASDATRAGDEGGDR